MSEHDNPFGVPVPEECDLANPPQDSRGDYAGHEQYGVQVGGQTIETDGGVSLPSPEPAPEVPAEEDRFCTACRIARGEEQPDPNAPGHRVVAGQKNLNGRGRGDWWYRMVYRQGGWTYFSDGRLPTGIFLASDRRATVYGEVFLGELICCHDYGKPVDGVALVVAPDGGGNVLEWLEYGRRRDGTLSVTLPDGSKVVVPDPRSK